MKAQLLAALMTALFKLLSPENMKAFVDAGLDAIEDYIASTPNKVDDRLLPLIGVIRKTFNIPDND